MPIDTEGCPSASLHRNSPRPDSREIPGRKGFAYGLDAVERHFDYGLFPCFSISTLFYFNDALTLIRYSAAFANICASFSVRIFASRTTTLPLTITSRTSEPFNA
jgi:hypothetical protein